MDKSIKILLIMVHSTQNAGDLALLQVSIHHLKKYIKNSQFVISANYPEEIWFKEKGYKVIPTPIALIGKSKNAPAGLQLSNFIIGVVFTLMFILKLRFLVPIKWRSLLDEYEKNDLVVAVPGNQIFSTGRLGWPYPANIFSVVLAHWFRKPLYILPQSIGPFRWWWEKVLIRYAYSKAKLIFLRDQVSMETAQKIGLPGDKVLFAPDPALALKPSQQEKAYKLLCNYGWNPTKHSLGVTIIAPQGRFLDPVILENYYSVLASTLVRFSLKWDLQVVFFVQVTGPTEVENDRIPTSLIYKKISTQVKSIYIDDSLTPEMLKACYGKMDIFLASRLHSGIFSISMGVPTVFIGYLVKTQGVLKSLGLEKYGISLEDVNEARLLDLLESVWKNKEELTDFLYSEIKQTVLKVSTPFQKIVSLCEEIS